MTSSHKSGPAVLAHGHQLEIEDIRRELSDAEYHAAKEKIERAERTLEEVKELLTRVPFLQNGKLSTGTIDYAAFRVETLSLIFEIARQTFLKTSPQSDAAYNQFLNDLGDEVGLTFARDLTARLIKRGLFLAIQDVRKLLDLWASFENDTGAGETTVKQYSSEKITIRLRNNPLRRAETRPHAHCGFYRSYLTSLLNEVFTIRSRFIRANVEGASVNAQSVVEVTELPDSEDQCVFSIRCRSEKLVRSFDLLTAAYDQFYKLEPHEDFSVCMGKARAALVTAQMEAIGLDEERAPRNLFMVYKGLLAPQMFKQMDEAFQRVSKPLHAEAKSSTRMELKYAWGLLRDIRKCLYSFETLELDDTRRTELRDQAARIDRLATIEELAGKAQNLAAKDKDELKELLSELKKGVKLSEDRQLALAAMIRKIGEKAWEVARPVLSETLTAAAKKQFGLD